MLSSMIVTRWYSALSLPFFSRARMVLRNSCSNWRAGRAAEVLVDGELRRGAPPRPPRSAWRRTVPAARDRLRWLVDQAPTTAGDGEQRHDDAARPSAFLARLPAPAPRSRSSRIRSVAERLPCRPVLGSSHRGPTNGSPGGARPAPRFARKSEARDGQPPLSVRAGAPLAARGARSRRGTLRTARRTPCGELARASARHGRRRPGLEVVRRRPAAA